MVKIHFLNVGCGDCTIIHFPARERKNSDGSVHNKPERIMMLDMNHHEDHEEYENVIEYYKRNFRNPDGSLKSIFRFVSTHPHHDHICGLNKLFNDNEIAIWNFWHVDHEFVPESFDGHPTHKDDWNLYDDVRKRINKNPTIIKTYRGDAPRPFWDDDGDRITILSPSLEMIKEVHSLKEDGSKRKPHEIDIDHISFALLLRINNKKIIFAGDGREDCWEDILKNCANDIKDCLLLKAGHHGHESAFHEKAVKHMNPKYIIFSNNSEEDESNGASEKYQNALPDTTIYKTCDLGTLLAECPLGDEDISFYTVSKPTV